MEYTKIPFGGSLVLKFFNPLFNDINSYSLPMSFNNKIPSVQRAFGYPDKRDAEIRGTLEARIKLQFLDLIGSWNIVDSSESTINAFFTPGSGDFYSQINGKLLNDIDFGDVRWPVGELADWPEFLEFLNTKMNVSYLDSEYTAFCAYMPNAVNKSEYGIPGFVNEVTFSEEDAPIFENSFSIASVYLFAGTVIDYLFNNLGYKIEENIFRKDPDLKQLVIFNTFNLRGPLNSAYFDKTRIDYKDLVPHISCGDFIKAIRNRFNIGFFINEQQKSVRIRSFDSIITDFGRYSVCSTRPKRPVVENNRLTGIIFPLNPPDAWSTHSFKSADELSNLIVISKYRDILPLTRTVGDLLFVQSEANYYRIILNEEDPPVNEAQKISTDMFPYTEGITPEEMTQLSAIPAMYTHTINQAYTYLYGGNTYTNNTDVDYLIPRCDLVGNGYDQPFTEFPLMFLFARGIVNCYTKPTALNHDDPVEPYANLAAFPATGSIGVRYLALDSLLFYRWNGASYAAIVQPEPAQPPIYTYPFGTSDVYGAEGTKLSTANLALKWGGDYGLIKKYWTNRINWELNIKKLIKADLLSEDIPKLIDMDEWKRMADDNYLVSTFEIAIDGKKARLQNVELFRL
jgi:hypothetical protein